MAVLSLFRIRFAVLFWQKARLVAFAYVAAVILLALVQLFAKLFFHVQL